MEITGTIKVIHKEEKVSDKFKKRVFVITDTASQYPQIIPFELVNDKCGLIDAYKAGDEVKVLFNVRGREWTSPKGELKYFTSLNAWRIESVSSGNQSEPTVEYTPESFSADKTESDDLPF